MEKLKEIVVEFNKKEITYDLELHSYNPNLSPQIGLLLTSEKRKNFNTCIKIMTYEDMPQNRYLYSISMSTKDCYLNVGILVITPTSTLAVFRNLV